MGAVKIQTKSGPTLTTRKPCFLLIKKNLEVIPQLCLQVMSPAAPIYHPWRFFYTLMWKESGPIVISTTPTAVLSFANEALAPSKNQLSEKNSLPFLPMIYPRQGREAGFKTTFQQGFPAHPWRIPDLRWFFLPQTPLSQITTACERRRCPWEPSFQKDFLPPLSFHRKHKWPNITYCLGVCPLGQLSRARNRYQTWP